MTRNLVVLASTAVLAVGCASSPREVPLPKADEYATAVGDGAKLHWQPTSDRDTFTTRIVDSLVRAPLSLSDAVQVALVNNRGLQGEYQSLGIARAQLIQAGLLRNPTISGALKMGLDGIGNGFEFGLAQQIVSLFTIPRKKRLAAAEMEVAKHSLTASIANLIESTQVSYVAYQADIKRALIRDDIVEIARLAAEMAKRQHDAGNISNLELAAFQSGYERARLGVMIGKAELSSRREDLAKNLGLSENTESLQVSDSIADIRTDSLSVAGLEAIALGQRADLKAAELDIIRIGRQAGIDKTEVLIPDIELGVNYEKEISGDKNITPSLSVQIPVFDRGTAVSEASRARIRIAQEHFAELAIRIRSDVRAGVVELNTTRERALHIQNVLLPLKSKITEESQLMYNGMYIGVYQLLDAKKDELEVQQMYLDAIEQYWTAHAKLTRIVGSPLPVSGR